MLTLEPHVTFSLRDYVPTFKKPRLSHRVAHLATVVPLFGMGADAADRRRRDRLLVDFWRRRVLVLEREGWDMVDPDRVGIRGRRAQPRKWRMLNCRPSVFEPTCGLEGKACGVASICPHCWGRAAIKTWRELDRRLHRKGRGPAGGFALVERAVTYSVPFYRAIAGDPRASTLDAALSMRLRKGGGVEVFPGGDPVRVEWRFHELGRLAKAGCWGGLDSLVIGLDREKPRSKPRGWKLTSRQVLVVPLDRVDTFVADPRVLEAPGATVTIGAVTREPKATRTAAAVAYACRYPRFFLFSGAKYTLVALQFRGDRRLLARFGGLRGPVLIHDVPTESKPMPSPSEVMRGYRDAFPAFFEGDDAAILAVVLDWANREFPESAASLAAAFEAIVNPDGANPPLFGGPAGGSHEPPADAPDVEPAAAPKKKAKKPKAAAETPRSLPGQLGLPLDPPDPLDCVDVDVARDTLKNAGADPDEIEVLVAALVTARREAEELWAGGSPKPKGKDDWTGKKVRYKPTGRVVVSTVVEDLGPKLLIKADSGAVGVVPRDRCGLIQDRKKGDVAEPEAPAEPLTVHTLTIPRKAADAALKRLGGEGKPPRPGEAFASFSLDLEGDVMVLVECHPGVPGGGQPLPFTSAYVLEPDEAGEHQIAFEAPPRPGALLGTYEIKVAGKPALLEVAVK